MILAAFFTFIFGLPIFVLTMTGTAGLTAGVLFFLELMAGVAMAALAGFIL